MDSLKKYPLPIQEKIQKWLSAPISQRLKEEIQSKLKEQSPSLVECFCKDLSFGTSGLRALMGPGPNRINELSIGKASEALARYLSQVSPQNKSIVLCYDNREGSEEFAKVAARVFAAHDICCYITKELRPVPYLSFLVRQLKTSAGVMITASHNPKEYNGYKVYWADGGEISPLREKEIEKILHALDEGHDIRRSSVSDPLIKELDMHQMDEAYFLAIDKLSIFPQENLNKGKELHIVYSSLHGTGVTLAPRALKRWGFTHVSEVKAECKIDPRFGHIEHPNPEEKEAYTQGLKSLCELKADIFLVNDGDADRIGVALNHKRKERILNGNEIATLCVYYLFHSLSEKKALPKNGALITTLVTTKLLDRIAELSGIKVFRVHVGFKFIAELMELWEREKKDLRLLCAAEESYGCLLGDYVRDKDGIAADCFVAEVARYAKEKGMDLVDLLSVIYKKYGIFRELQRALVFPPTEEGIARCKSIMEKMRKQPLKNLGGLRILSVEDYLKGTKEDAQGHVSKLALSPSNVLVFAIEGGGQIVLRPSGTEPKLRIHVEVGVQNVSDPELDSKKADEQVARLMKELERILQE